MFRRVGEIIAGLFGSAIGIGFMALAVLSLPLNIIVWMRWTGWEWWPALIATIVSGIIPLIGQLAYVVFTFIGLYFYYDAGWDWRQATNPTAKTFTIASLTPAEFEQFKTKTILPSLTKQCMDEAKVRSGFEGRIPATAARFCECYAKVAIAVTNQSDLAYQETHKGEAPGYRDRMAARLRAECS